MYRCLSRGLIVAWSWVVACSCLSAGEIQGQKPVPMIADGFRFQPGTWAVYSVEPKGTAETYRVYFSVLGEVAQKKGKAYWMEIEVTTTGTPAVVTRMLSPDTGKGPGDVQEAIVQVAGYRPFTVPRKYLKPDPKNDSEQVGQFVRFNMPAEPAVRTINWRGREVQAVEVRVTDPERRPVQVLVSEDAPPLCILRFDGPDATMELLEWGVGAKTKITGKPVGMWRWMAGLFSSAVTSDAQTESK